MGNIDKSVLKNIYQASKIGIESAEYLFGKVLDREIKSHLNNYVKQYSNIISQTEKILKNMSDKTLENLIIKNQFMWNGIDNISSYSNKQEIAEFLILSSKKGMDSIISYSNNDMVNDNVKKIANNYIRCERKNIQNIFKVIERTEFL